MSPPVVEQITSVLNLLLDDNEEREGLLTDEASSSSDHSVSGRKRINQLAWNTRYFRQRLSKMGFIVYGHPHSPVVPALLYSPSKIAYVPDKRNTSVTTLVV